MTSSVIYYSTDARKNEIYLLNIFVHLYKDRNLIPDSDRKIASLNFTVIIAKDTAISSRGVIGSDRIGSDWVRLGFANL